MDRQQEILYTLALSLIPRIGNVTFQHLIQTFQTPINVLNATPKDLLSHGYNNLIINNILKNYLNKNKFIIISFPHHHHPHHIPLTSKILYN